tara:strand:+ start:555 stop:671 length:117 start_codon:yes stop_codon:yes gene_type:complete
LKDQEAAQERKDQAQDKAAEMLEQDSLAFEQMKMYQGH